MKNELLVRRVRMKSFEKNPTNGGTPAMENNKIVIAIKKKLLKLKLLKDWRVLNCDRTVLKSTQKSVMSDVLYMNMYVNNITLLSEKRFRCNTNTKQSKELYSWFL